MTLRAANRIVIKCGSALLVDSLNGIVRNEWLSSLAQDIAKLRAQKKDILIVTSGAVALGRKALKLKSGKLKLEEKQAAAATGQVGLMQAWQDALRQFDIVCAQSLLTAYDTERRRNWLNARATFESLFSFGAIPIVNENDTIATEEIRYGDNDRLAARVAQMIGADALVLLSDIDGLYDANPRDNPSANHLPIVSQITPQIEAMAGGANSATGVGTGGMRTKIDAAIIATSAGANVYIADGREQSPIARILDGEKHTIFTAHTDPKAARISWLSHNLKPQGAFIIDAGASKALKKGGSLLPVGVKSIDGSFERGDAIAIKTEDGQIIARGLSAYNSADAAMIIGKKSTEIEEILGYSGRPALVHRDDMVLN